MDDNKNLTKQIEVKFNGILVKLSDELDHIKISKAENTLNSNRENWNCEKYNKLLNDVNKLFAILSEFTTSLQTKTQHVAMLLGSIDNEMVGTIDSNLLDNLNNFTISQYRQLSNVELMTKQKQLTIEEKLNELSLKNEESRQKLLKYNLSVNNLNHFLSKHEMSLKRLNYLSELYSQQKMDEDSKISKLIESSLSYNEKHGKKMGRIKNCGKHPREKSEDMEEKLFYYQTNIIETAFYINLRLLDIFEKEFSQTTPTNVIFDQNQLNSKKVLCSLLFKSDLPTINIEENGNKEKPVPIQDDDSLVCDNNFLCVPFCQKKKIHSTVKSQSNFRETVKRTIFTQNYQYHCVDVSLTHLSTIFPILDDVINLPNLINKSYRYQMNSVDDRQNFSIFGKKYPELFSTILRPNEWFKSSLIFLCKMKDENLSKKNERRLSFFGIVTELITSIRNNKDIIQSKIPITKENSSFFNEENLNNLIEQKENEYLEIVIPIDIVQNDTTYDTNWFIKKSNEMLVGRFLDQNKNEWYDLPIRIVETKWNHRKSRKCAKFRIPKMNTFYCIVGRNIQYHFIFKNESQHFQIPQLLSIKQRSLMQKNNEKKTMKLSIEVFPLSLEVLDDLLSNENVPMFDNVKYFSNIFNIKQPFPKKRNLKNKIVEMNFVEFKIDLYNLKNLKGIHTLLDFQELILYNTKNNIENFLKDHVEGNNSLSDITECIQEKLQSQLQTQSQIMKQVQSYRGDLESFKQYLRLYTKVLQDSNSKQKYRRLDVSNIRSKMEHLREKDIQVWLKNKSIFEKEEMDDKLWKSYKMEKKEIRKLRLHSPQLTSIAHLRNKPEYFIHNPSSTNTLEETDDVDEWLESLRPIERFKSTFILPSTDYNCLFIMVRTTIQEEYTPNNSNKFLKENELLRKIIKIDENNLEKKSNDENKSFNRIILSNWRILQKSEYKNLSFDEDKLIVKFATSTPIEQLMVLVLERLPMDDQYLPELSNKFLLSCNFYIASIIVRHHFLHKTNVAIGISLKRYQYSLLDKMSQYGFIYSSMDEKDSLTFICHEGDQLKMECIGNIKLELREMNDDKKVFVFRKNKLSLKLFAMNIDNLNSTNDTVFYGGSIQFTSKLNNEKYKKFYELSKVQNNIINHGCLRLLIKRSIINDTNLSQSTSVNNHITKNNQKNDCEKIIKSNYISEEKEKFDIFIQKLFSFNSILLTEELWEKVGKALRIHILQTDQSLTTNELFTQIFALCDKWYFKQNKKYDKIQLFVRLIRSEKNLNELEKIIEKII